LMVNSFFLSLNHFILSFFAQNVYQRIAGDYAPCCHHGRWHPGGASPIRLVVLGAITDGRVLK
jgi:hypothetical protein